MSLALLWLAQILAGPLAASSPVAPVPGSTAGPALLPAPLVLQRYTAAIRKVKEPRVISFDYTLEQTGPRTLSQTHRVFRAGSDERDETLTVDGKRLNPPKVRIFRGRRDRYTIALLAPHVADYDFAFIGPRKDGHHLDYVFRLTPKAVRPFAVTDVTIDGVRFLPLAIGFSTGSNDGAGSIAFGSNTRWWVPYVAEARATVGADPATEKLTFYTYRFPATLPPSTFSQARRPALPAAGPAAPQPATPKRVSPFAPVRSRVVAPEGALPVRSPLTLTRSALLSPVRSRRPRRAPFVVPPQAPLLLTPAHPAPSLPTPAHRAVPVGPLAAAPTPTQPAL